MRRIVLVFEYIGTKFSGYQVQPEKRTVQGEMEKLLTLILAESTKIYASGRTDSGVHSLGQVAHFDTEKEFKLGWLQDKLNSNLPEDISIQRIYETDESFDSRFSVKVKTYGYRFYLSRYERATMRNRALRVNDNVDVNEMKSACKYLVGEHDFTSFVARKSGKDDFVRTIYNATIKELGDGLYEFEISGNGFLYNMVRIIMGTLIDIGSKRKPPEDMKRIIDAKNRSLAGKTVEAHGLYMKSVVY